MWNLANDIEARSLYFNTLSRVGLRSVLGFIYMRVLHIPLVDVEIFNVLRNAGAKIGGKFYRQQCILLRWRISTMSQCCPIKSELPFLSNYKLDPHVRPWDINPV